MVLIFILGLFLRLYGSYPGYPQTNADESTIQGSTTRIAFEGSYEPNHYYYGAFLPLIYSLTYKYFFEPLVFPLFLAQSADYSRFGPTVLMDNFFGYLQRGIPLNNIQFYDPPYWSRYDTVLLSSLSTLLVFFLTRRLFNTHAGLLAAFFIAVNLRHVISSRLALAAAS